MPVIPPTTLRLINLADLLREEACLRLGGPAELPDPPGEPGQWTEADVRAHFARLGQQQQQQEREQREPADDDDHPDFARWVPGLPLSRTAPPPGERPRARIVAFPCAGSAEDMYSAEGTGVRRAASPLLDWCRANAVELLAVQPPGRGARGRETPITSAAALASAALPILARRLVDKSVPWFLLGHSAGAWVGYEFGRAAVTAGLPPPARAFLSAMLPPDTPPEDRPWTPSAGLSTAGLQAECRAWGMAEAVLSPAVWPAFENLLRADFRLFDEYEWAVGEAAGGGLAAAALPCPLTVFAGTRDGRCPPGALGGWARFAAGGGGGGEGAGGPAFELVPVEGPHLWPLDRAAKSGWLAAIAARAAAELEGLGKC